MKKIFITLFILSSLSSFAEDCLSRAGKNSICIGDTVFLDYQYDATEYDILKVLDVYSNGTAKVLKNGNYLDAAFEEKGEKILKSYGCIELKGSEICDGDDVLVETNYGKRLAKVKGVFKETQTIAHTIYGQHDWIINKSEVSKVTAEQLQNIKNIKINSNILIKEGYRKGYEAKVTNIFESGDLVVEMVTGYFQGLWFNSIDEVELKESLKTKE